MSRLAQLKEAKRLRAEGKSTLSLHDDAFEDDAIYDEVDDAGYRRVVQNRLLEKDFVVDDNGMGYADDGRYDWERQDESYDESEEEEGEQHNKRKKKKNKKEISKRQRNSLDKFMKQSAAPKAAPLVRMTAEEDAAFMDGLLGEIGYADMVNTPSRSRTVVKPASNSSRPSFTSTGLPRNSDRQFSANFPSSPPALSKIQDSVAEDEPTLDQNMSPAISTRIANPTKTEYDSEDDEVWTNAALNDSDSDNERISSNGQGVGNVESDEDVMEVERQIGTSAVQSKVNIAASKVLNEPKMLTKPEFAKFEISKIEPIHAKEAESWTAANSALPIAVSSSPSSASALSNELSISDAAETDGSLRFYWTDFCEIRGRLILYGKSKLRDSNRYVSTMVQIRNVDHRLYFLPRRTRYQNGANTSSPVTIDDVMEEVDTILSSKSRQVRLKECRRNYAFELPDVPSEATYVEALYPFSDPGLESDISGETFSHVFGSGSSMFEQFVLVRNIMGPCWLEVKHPFIAKDFQRSSWCKIEAAASEPDMVSVIPDLEPPPITIMSISLRTVMDHAKGRREIAVISGRVFENIAHDTVDSPENLRPVVFTMVRPLNKIFPAGFENEVKRKGRGTILLERTEASLLASFLSRVQRYDPDFYAGHNLNAGDLHILLNRMKILKTPTWHRMGRSKLSEWPMMTGKSLFGERRVVSGRLLCDLANDMGKSVMTKCQTWSLSEMCSLILGQTRHETEEIDIRKAASWTDSATGLFEYVTHCELDTHYIMSLAVKTQLLPLTKQLTNLAGNSWAHTLNGTRSERNEYILMHEFYRKKYIIPDKAVSEWSKKRNQATVPEIDEDNDDEQNDEEAVNSGTKKRDKFKGGLVLEPSKGLHDKFVLVMDFNSLYPSIIQEFNICFTTVDRSRCTEANDVVPDPPSSEVPQGVLPKLIATLVSRRRQVKNLMKDTKATSAQKAQWDIKQQALKLTANSMYGCLGYTKSRFYARPLAMLTTFKGREILTNTKELAESLSLRVVYGDTDSVMINTNTTSYEAALKIGNEFKSAVNERYRLLEIDIDNVFQRLMLYAKKKYAAVNCTMVNQKLETHIEIKGLDMRRREYCALSKDASRYALDQILSGESIETVVERVHEYLRELGGRVREGEIGPAKFIIHTKLGKDPSQYQGGKSMPQVQVALKRKARGEVVSANDVMSYIIAAPTGELAQFASNPAERALPAVDFLKGDKQLKPDYEHYLAKQILPPVERLCTTIEGTDAMHLASCLGLDPRKYMIQSSDIAGPFEYQPLESTIPEEELYSSVKRLELVCVSCGSHSKFEGLVSSRDMCTPNGVKCIQCSAIFPAALLVVEVERLVRREIMRYYEGWLFCDDSSCSNRTRQISVYGKRCIGKDGLASSCRGVMAYEYTDKDLYRQLQYLDYVFNVDKVKKGGDAELEALAEHNRPLFEAVRQVAIKYLGNSARRYVDFHNIFGFMEA
ncbi:uncharacterized protein V1516DRAFT_669307 [Lipomyces oligophaga]|uniref:uncharacterized protein n=1 Tax=Lipomyces oligophaga TaxID=45792 RepID=UPI0034CE9290